MEIQSKKVVSSYVGKAESQNGSLKMTGMGQGASASLSTGSSEIKELQHKQVVKDGYVAAKRPTDVLTKVDPKPDGPKAGGVTGCCLPLPPKISFPESNKPADPLLRGYMEHQAKSAQTKLEKTTNEALKDGYVSFFERRDIDAAGRDANIAQKQLALDDARQGYQESIRQALADNRMTPEEAAKINAGQQKIQDLNKQLKSMQAEDKRQDHFDDIVDYGAKLKPNVEIDGPGGMPKRDYPIIGPGSMLPKVEIDGPGGMPKRDYPTIGPGGMLPRESGPGIGPGPGGLWPPSLSDLKFPSFPDFPKLPSFDKPAESGPFRPDPSDYADRPGIIGPKEGTPGWQPYLGEPSKKEPTGGDMRPDPSDYADRPGIV